MGLLKNVLHEARVEPVRQLGYDVEGHRILKKGEPAPDPYLEGPSALDNMALDPGGAFLLQEDAAGFAAYFEGLGDWSFAIHRWTCPLGFTSAHLG